MQRTIRRDAATLGLEGAPAYPPPSRESTTISSTFSREATIPRSSTFLREATGSNLIRCRNSANVIYTRHLHTSFSLDMRSN